MSGGRKDNFQVCYVHVVLFVSDIAVLMLKRDVKLQPTFTNLRVILVHGPWKSRLFSRTGLRTFSGHHIARSNLMPLPDIFPASLFTAALRPNTTVFDKVVGVVLAPKVQTVNTR